MELMQRDHGRAALRSGSEGTRRPALAAPPERPWARLENRWTLASVPTAPAAAATARVDAVDRVFVVRPAGALPDRLPERLAERLAGLIADRPVIIDLSGSEVDSAAPVVGLAGSVLGVHRPDRCCVVCARPTRELLREEDITQHLAVFGSIGDALQARCFARDGYGSGWLPDPPRPPRAPRPARNGAAVGVRAS